MPDTIDEPSTERPRREDQTALALVVIWCADASRVGEVLLLDDEDHVFGRGGSTEAGEIERRVTLLRQRPGENVATTPLDLPALSRTQLVLRVEDGGVRVANVGRREVDHDPPILTAKEHLVSPGDTFEVRGQIAFVCVERTRTLKRLRSADSTADFPFGAADRGGFVGESPLAWALRDQMCFMAARTAHVLVLGESGTGKEVVAQSIHARSRRAQRTLVSRSAATIPTGLADAELFGNLANYPNPGMPERKGLVGEADGSTLFLDEIGELPEDLQARLLRVLDERGEYHRLGEGRSRRSDLRLVAATNRPLSALKHDVAARFRLRLTVPGLEERREDIALLARHLLGRIARHDPEIGARFFEGWDGKTGEPRLSAPLVRALTRSSYRTHVRELEALLWRSLATSDGEELALTRDVEEAFGDTSAGPSPRRASELTVEEVKRALERAGGVQDRAWRDLGLANRFALHRLMKKMGLGQGQVPGAMKK